MKSLKIFYTSIIIVGLLSFCLFADPVEVTRVRPSKITYLAGEQATAAITLKNTIASNIKGVLKVTEKWDADGVRDISTEEIILPAGQEKAVNIAWKISSHLYGHALHAVFYIDGKQVAEKSEFYQVSLESNWFRMFILNGGSNRDKNRDAEQPFSTYGNYRNCFAYALSDCVALAPDVNVYYSGQTAYKINRDELITSIKERHETGVRTGGYTQTVAGGPAGYEFAREHPDWIARTSRGAFHTSGSPVSPLDVDGPVDRLPSEKYTSKTYYMLVPDFGNPEMVKYAAGEIISAVKMFDFDAMYFDTYPYGMFYWPHIGYDETMFTWDGKPLNRGKDPDLFTAEILREVRRIIRRSCPNLVLWYNGMFSLSSQWKRATIVAALEDPQGGSLREVQGKSMIDDKPWSNWRVIYESLIASRNAVMKNPKISSASFLVGYIYNMYFDKKMTKEEFAASRDTWTMSNHVGAILLASHFHPCLLCTGSFRPAMQFMTRYSCFLWDERIKLLEKPWERITVNSNREVWWEEACYTRQCENFKDTIIHIINAPEKETTDYKAAQDPPSVRDSQLEMSVATDKKIRAWAMQPYNYGDTVCEPTQILLNVQRNGKKATIDIPSFAYTTMIVIREYE